MDSSNYEIDKYESILPIILANLTIKEILNLLKLNKYFYVVIVPMVFNRLET